MLNLENIDFEAKKLAAMVRMRIHCFDIPKMYCSSVGQSWPKYP